MPVTSRKDLNSRGGSDWELGAVFTLEHEKVKERIRTEAVQAVNRPGMAPAALMAQASSLDAILALKNDIRAKFHPDRRLELVDRPKFEAAQRSVFQTLSPSKATVRTWALVAAISVAVELTVIVVLSLMEGELSFGQILLAVVLAAGGWFSGMGTGQFLFNHYVDDQQKKGEVWINQSEKTNSSVMFLTLAAGLLMVVSCTIFRYKMADNDLNVGGITLMLGLFILIAEANSFLRRTLYEKYLDLQLEAQVFYAVEEHNKFNPFIHDAVNYNSKTDPCALAYLQALNK